jgi:putative flippase GtrA
LSHPLVAKHRVKIVFVLSGTWNTLFAIIIFTCLHAASSHIFVRRYVAYMSAYALTNILSICNAFILHKYMTFQSTAKGKSLVMEFIRFSCTYASVFVLSMLLFPVLVEGLHITPDMANVVGILISIAVSYLGHSKFSFKAEDRRR